MKYLGCLVLLLLFSACNMLGTSQKETEKPTLVVAIEPLRYFADILADGYFNVVSLVPQGNSPESYDPTPAQLIALSRCKAYMGIPYIGFEMAWRDRLKQNAPGVPFIDITEGMELIHSDVHRHFHAESNFQESEHHHAVEPHVWTSPAEASVIVENMVQVLTVVDTLHRDVYRHRADSLRHELQQLDSLFACRLQPGGAFMVYHPTLSYMARRYGLQQLCIEEEGREPSPAYLAELIEEGRRKGIKVVFVQPEFDSRHAGIIAKELGAEVVEINPLAYEWKEQMVKVMEEMLDL